jgi:uncharacterized phage-associated protein
VTQTKASAHDVAAYLLQKHGAMTAMKLQKLLYYSQAWSLVWDEAPLFKEPIEAWANGPVVPEVYAGHRGEFSVSIWPSGDAAKLTKVQTETVDAVLSYYGNKTAQYLSDLTHLEEPWRLARKGLDPSERSQREITLASMAEYYGTLEPGKSPG